MRTNARLYLLVLLASLLPLAVLFILTAALRYPLPLAALCAAAAAAAGGVAVSALVSRGLVRPFLNVSASVKKFIAADYKLNSPLPKDGWLEASGFVSAMNRVMLELSAYRGFRLNQVMEESGRAEALIETITDGVLLVDDDGKVICSNHAALKLLGIAKSQAEVILPGAETNAAFTPVLRQMLASGEMCTRAELAASVPGSPGHPLKDFQVISTRFLRATLKRAGRVIVIRDISMEKEIENTKETFFQMITHDMRAPLSSIVGYTNMLSGMPAPSPESSKCLETITRSAKRLNSMIDDILDATKLERGDMPLEASRIQAAELLARVCEAQAPDAKRRGIELSLLPPAGAVEFTGDYRLLERVVLNLVGNSLKFTQPGGAITLSCRESGGDAIFSVEDTGPGIPEDKRTMIFEKYAQMDEHRDFGFGLGLAICKMIVELHGGRIWVESEVGKGSRFIFSIPPAAAQILSERA